MYVYSHSEGIDYFITINLIFFKIEINRRFWLDKLGEFF